MKKYFTLFIVVFIAIHVVAQKQEMFIVNKEHTHFELTLAGASHLASLPLKCIAQEFPNKTSHTSNSDSDHVLLPHQLHPAFFGCFDWHSCVHGHWMLVALLKKFPDLPEAKNIRNAINNNITPEKILQEVKYFEMPLTASWERTYGWAWLLKLDAELATWNDADCKKWHAALQPLTQKIINTWLKYLPKQTYPNRTGVHPNTAFGLVLALDYARLQKNKIFENAIVETAKRLYLQDKNAPANWEPDGTDFLSPSLEESDLMRRVLPAKDFLKWFNQFYTNKSLLHLTKLPVVSDRKDLQIVHLDGLSFSRSWCMKGIASSLPQKDTRRKMLLNSAIQHLATALPHIASGEYGGEHWLASFAVYALVNEN